MQHETISADEGKQLHIRLSGSGTPIPLLHGWTSSHAAWAPLIKPLAGQHRFLRTDARGHGGHALSATRAPDIRRLARNVINLLDHFDEATGDSSTPPDIQPTQTNPQASAVHRKIVSIRPGCS